MYDIMDHATQTPEFRLVIFDRNEKSSVRQAEAEVSESPE
jgi:hypothetical protein